MQIKTKYNLGEQVYPIRLGRHSEHIKCKICEGKGEVTINNTEKIISCPECYGQGGRTVWLNDKWGVCVGSIGYIGKISVEIYDKAYEEGKREYRYMLDSTGVGGGTLWKEDMLFTTKEEAEKECEIRNNSSEKKVEQPSYLQQGGSKRKRKTK